MGSVYRATQLGLGRQVAVKVLTMAGDEALARFQREAQVLAHLEHPGIVRVHDFGVDAGQAFLVMELVEGMTLERYLEARGCPPPARFTAIATALLDALAAAHAAGIVHRDIKPANLMLRDGGEGNPVILDFGIASTQSNGTGALTQVGTVMGTAAYMSPEQVRGEVVDARADIYSAGCLLYELASGHPPFEATSPADVLAAQLYREPLALSKQQLPQPVSVAVDACLLKALSKRPEDRYEHAPAFSAALKEAAEAATSRSAAKKGRPEEPAPSPVTVGDRPVRVALLGSGGTPAERELMQNAMALAGIVTVQEGADVQLNVLALSDDIVEVARASLARAPGVPLVLCVHRVDPAQLAQAIAVGVHDVLLWPPEPTRVIRKLIQASRRKRPA